MATSTPTVFVAGATGSQGFCLATKLRNLGWNVHTTARDLEAPGADELTKIGVKLTKGDWDDEAALKASIAGCDKLFLCLMSNPADPDHERRQTESIISIARAAGVTQVVSSTSLGCFMYPDDSRLAPGTLLYPLVAVKKESELIVTKAGFASYTLLRPAYHMSNFLEPIINMFTDILVEQDWKSALKPETKIGLIDHDDIARFAVAAFKDPEKFHGQAIGLASELLSPQETMNQLGQAMGRPLKASYLTEEEIDALPYGPIVVSKCERSMRYMPDYLDMKALAAVAPLTSFKAFLEREKESVKKF